MPEQNEEEEAKKVEQQLKVILRSALVPEAYDRMSNIKIANKELYLTTAKHIMNLYKRFNRKLTDEELQKIIKAILSEKEKESRITFTRK